MKTNEKQKGILTNIQLQLLKFIFILKGHYSVLISIGFSCLDWDDKWRLHGNHATNTHASLLRGKILLLLCTNVVIKTSQKMFICCTFK